MASNEIKNEKGSLDSLAKPIESPETVGSKSSNISPLSIEELLGPEPPKKKNFLDRLAGIFFPPSKSEAKTPVPIHYKGKGRKYGYIGGAIVMAIVLALAFFSTPNKELAKQWEAHNKPSKTVPASSFPAAPSSPSTPDVLVPLIEAPSAGSTYEDSAPHGTGRYVTPQDVLKTADPKAQALSPSEQIKHWQRQAAKWEAEAKRSGHRGNSDRGYPGSAAAAMSSGEPEARAEADKKTWRELENDIRKYQMEKDSFKTGGTGLGQLQPDFSKLPNPDNLAWPKTETAPYGSRDPAPAPGPEASSTASGGGPSSQTPPSAESKGNPLSVKSLVFLREEKKIGADTVTEGGRHSGKRGEPRLPITTKIKARLQSTITTSVDLPVLAVVEQDVMHDGEILIPRESTVFGRLSGANRNGDVALTFDTILTPDNKTIKINGVAQGLNGIGPLKGQVSGKNMVKKAMAGTLSGIGAAGALLVGRPGRTSGAFTYGDYMRERLTYNTLNEGDRAIARLNQTENLVVSVPANTRFDIVLLSTVKAADRLE